MLILLAVFCLFIVCYATILKGVKYAHILKNRFNDRGQEINWCNLFGTEFWLHIAIDVVCGFVAWLCYVYGSSIYSALIFIVAIIVILFVFFWSTIRRLFMSELSELVEWILMAGIFGMGAGTVWGTKPVLAFVFYITVSFIIINTVSRFICIFSKK